MKKYYLIGLISGVLITSFSLYFAFIRYYVFTGPNEAWVRFDGQKVSFRIEQFSEVNDFLGNSPGGRKAFIYPTSDSSYSIVYLPRKNRHLDQIEREEISRTIREKMRY
jgi:hypothetical protein